MAYPYYSNNPFYVQELQSMKDNIDRQIRQYQQQNQMQTQQVPTNLTQTFQLAPQINSNSELQCQYADNIEQVKNTFVMKTGIFINKDFTSMWVKTTDGNIRTYDLNEVIQQDPKDVEINNLKQELQRVREMINYGNKSDVNNSNDDGADENKNATKLSTRTKSNAK